MESYVVINGKKFRRGYTTGTCAAAASKAAAEMLFSKRVLESISVDTPAGVRVTLAVIGAEFLNDTVRCAVVKDGGDDPDVTTGLKIFAEARVLKKGEIKVKAGKGIGRATLSGLKVKVGEPAINPVPMSMILKEVKEVLPLNSGVEVTLSVPGGEEVAKRTYNPTLGIEGGISILGTTGIVEPMSEEAWKESLALKLNVMAAKGVDRAVYVFGNYGEAFVSDKLEISSDYVVKMSNFVGFMLDKGAQNGFNKILMAGHLGKLVKVAAGIFHTHSRTADARMEILASYAALEGASQDVIKKIYNCRTTEAAAEIIENNGLARVYERIVSNVSKRCTDYTYNRVKVGTVLFSADNKLLAADKSALEIIREMRGIYEV